MFAMLQLFTCHPHHLLSFSWPHIFFSRSSCILDLCILLCLLPPWCPICSFSFCIWWKLKYTFLVPPCFGSILGVVVAGSWYVFVQHEVHHLWCHVPFFIFPCEEKNWNKFFSSHYSLISPTLVLFYPINSSISFLILSCWSLQTLFSPLFSWFIHWSPSTSASASLTFSNTIFSRVLNPVCVNCSSFWDLFNAMSTSICSHSSLMSWVIIGPLSVCTCL